MTRAIDDDYDDYDSYDDSDDDIDVDVCQHCGGYFEWTTRLREAWQKHWQPSEKETQPQRCFRCIVDECWIEDRDS